MENAVRAKELEPWLRETLKPQVATAEKAVQKTKSEVEAQIASLREMIEDLLRKSEKDTAEKRDNRAVYKAARAVNRMCLELEDLLSSAVLGNPESYEGLKQFSDATARVAGEAARIRDRWVGYIRPYYILDMMGINAAVEKFRRLGDQSWGVFTKEGGLLRSLEEVRSKVQRIEGLEASLQKGLNERDQVVDEMKKLAPQIRETERLIESLTINPKIAELKKIDNRLKELRGELLALGFRRLGRPLRKLEAMAGRGEYPVTPETREKLSEYLKRPFKTFISEEEGYPALKSVLQTMREALQRKKLVLKQREERKVLERIDNVTERNVLDRIHREATALVAERRRFLQDPQCLELVRTYKRHKKDLKNLHVKHEDLDNQSRLLSEKVEGVRGSLAQFVKETGLLAERLVKRPVRLQLDAPYVSA